MATTADQMRSDSARAPVQLRDVAPWIGLAVWLAGAFVIWYVGKRNSWEIGTQILAGCVWIVVGAVAARDAVRGMFGPVFMYEVVRLGRKKLTIILRLVYVFGTMVLLGIMYLAWLDDVGYFDNRSGDRVPSEHLSKFATEFFVTFMAVQYCVVGFLTPAYVAGAIADEKERKTLEFLATDLRNHEIIFGKLAARVTVLLMFVLAGLPVVAFLQLFGGIDPDLLLAGTAATVITVLGLAAVSVFFSTVFKKPRDAIALAYMAAVLYLVGSGFLAGYVRIGLLMIPARAGGGLGTTDLGDGYVIDWTEVVEAVAVGTDWIAAGNVLYVILMSFNPAGLGFSPAAIADALFRYAVFWTIASAFFLGYSVLKLRSIALHQAYGGQKRVRRGTRRIEPDTPWAAITIAVLALLAGGVAVVVGAPVGAIIVPIGVLLALVVFLVRSFSGSRSDRADRSRPAMGNDPMFWKEVFVDSGSRGGCVGSIMALIVVILVFIVPVLIFVNIYGDKIPVLGPLLGPSGYHQTVAQRWEDFTHGMNVWVRIATGLLGAMIMIAAAVRGSGAVSGERDRDTWVSLVSTPMTAWEMVRGKWLGCILGLRKAYAVMLMVWALGLVCGAVDPPMILVTALYMAVYVSAFAWVGILCSVTSRTTLIATVRALMIAVFLGGGFWFFLGVCCILPLNIMFRSRDVDFFEHVEQILAGWTPPFVLGWLPLNGYERHDLGPFAWEEDIGIGPLSPVLGFFVWFGLAWVLGLMTWQAFRRVSNRSQDVLDGQLPRPSMRDGTKRARRVVVEEDDEDEEDGEDDRGAGRSRSG